MSNLNYEKVFNTLVDDTEEYLIKNNLQAMVLGISGGIDSTVVAAICHEVSKRTGIPLIGRSLPIKNKEDEFDVSKLVAEAFCDDFKCIPLQNSYTAFLNNLMFEESQVYVHSENIKEAELSAPDKQTPIANGNIQARLRMIYLYNLASIHKGLVMSTDNQTEYQLGFWTIHGDVGDFDPIQDLWKTEVYELANYIHDREMEVTMEYLANKYTGTIMTEEIQLDMAGVMSGSIARCKAIEASMALTPTDGLGISNSDLDQIGAKSYAEVDAILQDFESFVEFGGYKEGTSLRKIANDYLDAQQMLNVPIETIIKVIDRHVASNFKRMKSPIYIPRYKYNY